MANNDLWWTTPTQSESGETVIVTGRDGIDNQRTSGKYTDRIELTWKYADSGMPADDIADLIEQADEALRTALKKEKGVILTGIYTGAGERNWIFYAKNTGIFQGMLNRAWSELPLLPVSIEAYKDEHWSEYSEMRDLTYISQSPDED